MTPLADEPNLSAAADAIPSGGEAISHRDTADNSCPSALDDDGTEPAAPALKARIPERIARYQIHASVGTGAFGTVYRARDPQLDREVALKVPRAGALDSTKVVARFLREAKTGARLCHPHIVPIYDFGRDGEYYYIASAFIEGQTLAHVIDEESLGVREAAHIVHDLAEALAYAHHLGIVHRDVKPGNIMLDAEGQPHLMDFGVAYWQEMAEKLTQEGAIIGTPEYMAPEQAQGKSGGSPALPASDQYSVGVVLYELLCGQRPFGGRPQVVLFNAIHQEPAAPRSLKPGLPPDLETICLKTLAKRPEERYPTCQELAKDLRRWLEGEPILARRLGPVERVVRWCRREPALAFMGAFAALCLIAVALVATVSATFLAHSAEGERKAKQEADDNAQAAEEEARNARRAEQQAKGEAEKARQAKEEAEAEKKKASLESENRAKAESERRQAIQREADSEKENARRADAEAAKQEQLNRAYRYVADLNLAQQALETGKVWRAAELLEAQRPKQGQEDKRSFEWYYLWTFCLTDGRNFPALLEPIKGTRDRIRCLACLVNSREWVAGTLGGAVALCNPDTNKVEILPERILYRFTSISVAPDGKAWAMGTGAGTVVLYDAKKRQMKKLLKGHSKPVTAVAFAPDSKTLASGSEDKTVILWDAATERVLATLPGHSEGVNSVAFALDGKMLAVASVGDSSIKLWDVATRQERAALKGHTELVQTLAVAPDGLTLASGSWDRTVKLWDMTTGRERHTLQGHEDTVLCLAFAPDGTMLASGGWDRTVRLWDVATGQALTTLKKGHTDKVNAVAFAPDGKSVVSAGEDKSLRLWRAGPKQVKAVSFGEPGLLSVACAPDGHTFATGGEKTIKLWDMATGKVVNTFAGHAGKVYSVAFSPDKGLLASGGEDKSVKLWEVVNEKERSTLQGHTGTVRSVAFAPRSQTVASASEDGTVRLWDASTGKELKSFAGHTGRVFSVAFSPDGALLASAGEDRSVRLWDMQKRTERAVLPGHAGSVRSVAFAPDSQTVASGSEDGTVRLWDVATGKKLMAPLKGHTGWVRSVAFARSGKMVASGSEDGMVQLWDVATGLPRATLRGSAARDVRKESPPKVIAIAFAPNGWTLAAVNENGTVQLWRGAAEEIAIPAN